MATAYSSSGEFLHFHFSISKCFVDIYLFNKYEKNIMLNTLHFYSVSFIDLSLQQCRG